MDEQLGVANALVEKGIPRNKVYEVIWTTRKARRPSVVDLGWFPRSARFVARRAPPWSSTVFGFPVSVLDRVLPALAESEGVPRD